MDAAMTTRRVLPSSTQTLPPSSINQSSPLQRRTRRRSSSPLSPPSPPSTLQLVILRSSQAASTATANDNSRLSPPLHHSIGGLFEYKRFFVCSRVNPRLCSPSASLAVRLMVALLEMPTDFTSSAFAICASITFLWDLK